MWVQEQPVTPAHQGGGLLLMMATIAVMGCWLHVLIRPAGCGAGERNWRFLIVFWSYFTNSAQLFSAQGWCGCSIVAIRLILRIRRVLEHT